MRRGRGVQSYGWSIALAVALVGLLPRAVKIPQPGEIRPLTAASS